jgi:hypothetical protein
MKWFSLAFVILDALIVLTGVGFSVMCLEPGTADAGQCVAFSLLFISLPALVFLLPGAILYLKRHYIAATIVCALPVAALAVYFSLL